MAGSTPVLGLDPRNPLLGRFGTPDPTTENPFSTQGWNRYAYVGNSPLRRALVTFSRMFTCSVMPPRLIIRY